MKKKLVLPLAIGALAFILAPGAALAQGHGGARGGGGGHEASHGFSGGRGFSRGGESRGGNQFSGRGFSGGERGGYYGGHEFAEHGRGRVDRDDGRYRGGAYFGYGAPYVYGPNYYYSAPCNPAGYYDQWGNWVYYPGCYVDPYYPY
jgi:hypothetical protein